MAAQRDYYESWRHASQRGRDQARLRTWHEYPPTEPWRRRRRAPNSGVFEAYDVRDTPEKKAATTLWHAAWRGWRRSRPRSGSVFDMFDELFGGIFGGGGRQRVARRR